MKPVVKVVLTITGILIALHAPCYAQGRLPNSYMEALRQAEAAVPTSADLAGGDAGALLKKASSQMGWLATMRAFTGDTEGAIASFDLPHLPTGGRGPGRAEDLKAIEDGTVEDAVQAIVAAARTRRVVLINEAHHVSMHRAFAHKLAVELRKIGYTYLAAETFSEPEHGRAAKGDVNLGFGTYTRDPVYADFVNQAMANGWKIVSYEAGPASEAGTREQRIEVREREQAKNLVDRIFAKDKEAKVLIFVGYGHLYKSRLPSGLMMMGAHLREMTGLDMVHVDQTKFYAHPESAAENPLYDALLSKPHANAPFVLRSKEGGHAVLNSSAKYVDLQVVFPRYAMRNGRPEWLETLAGRTPRDIPPTFRRGSRLNRVRRVPASVGSQLG